MPFFEGRLDDARMLGLLRQTLEFRLTRARPENRQYGLDALFIEAELCLSADQLDHGHGENSGFVRYPRIGLTEILPQVADAEIQKTDFSMKAPINYSVTTAYHVTPASNLPSIEKTGLEPRLGVRCRACHEQTPGVFRSPASTMPNTP